MTAPFRSFVVLIAGLCHFGPIPTTSGSVHAGDERGLEVNLVDMVNAIPEAVIQEKLLDARLDWAKAQRKRGGVVDQQLTPVNVESLRLEKLAASQRVELLRMMVESERSIYELRLELVAESATEQGIDTRLDRHTAKQRLLLLRRMQELLGEQPLEAPAETTLQSGE